MSTRVIPRRPVGSLGTSNSVKHHVKEHSLASSSVYSEHELEVPQTNISEYSLESVQLNDDDAPQLPPKDSLPPVPSKNDTVNSSEPPPIPPKDAARSPVDAAATFRLADNNFQKPEIWKRRSERSNSDLSFSDLPLSKSNGSTAGSPPKVQPPQRALPQIPSNAPVVRKALRSPPPPPQPDYMGAKNSKQRVGASQTPGRLPTPEYQKTDKQILTSPKVLSPVSPESPVSPPSLPKSLLRVKGVNSLLKKAVPKSSPPTIPSVQYNRSIDSGLTFANSETSSDAVTIVGPSDSTIFSAPQPKKAATARILTPQALSPATEVNSPGSWPLQSKSPFSARAIAFANAGTIHPGPSIDKGHYDCYQNHRFMRPSLNLKCPMACMTCEKKDTEQRWSCTWCCLRICTKCMEVLAANGKDLRVCMDKLGKGDQDRGRSIRWEKAAS